MTSCSDDNDDYPWVPPTPASVDGLFVVSNGNYLAGNGSLSYYVPAKNTVDNNVFQRANGMKLGDTAQSMMIDSDGTGWICVNGSNVIYAIDTDTYKVKGLVENVSSPRNIIEVSDSKYYVSALYDNRISIVDPSTYTVTGHIDIPEMDAAQGSTENMVKVGNYVYVNCWSYQKEVVKIDAATDKVVDAIEVGVQPKSIVYDGSSSLWVLCDGGGWEGNPAGYEAPSLVRINLSTFAVDKKVTLPLGPTVTNLCYYAGNLYWAESQWSTEAVGYVGGVHRMSAETAEAPDKYFIEAQGALYGIAVNPADGEIYVADAVDYQQAGSVVRYGYDGTKIDSFTVGVIPAAFCWKTSK